MREHLTRPRPAAGPAVGIVADLMRFPVKSLGGERARRVFIGPYGLTGDRRLAVIGADGGVVSARRAHALLGYRAEMADGDGGLDVRVSAPDGREWAADDPALARELSAALDREVQLARGAVGVFDAAPVHLVNEASVRAMDAWLGREVDVRRFRPNVVVELADGIPFGEAAWRGRRLALGPVELEVVSPTERCAVTTFDPDTLERDTAVLSHLARRRDNFFGVYAHVVRPGWVRLGDPVTLDPRPEG